MCKSTFNFVCASDSHLLQTSRSMIGGCHQSSIPWTRPVASPNTALGMVLRRWSGRSATRPTLRRASLRQELPPLIRGAAAAIPKRRPALITKRATGRAGACRLGVARTTLPATSTSAAPALLISEVAFWLTALQLNRVQPATQQCYFDALIQLVELINRKVLPTWTLKEWDDELPDLLTGLYARAAAQEAGTRFVLSLVGVWPQSRRPLQAGLPPIASAIAGWRRFRPTQSQASLPRLVLWAISQRTRGSGLALEALAALTLFGSYLQPSELLALLACRVLAPELGTRSTKFVGIYIRTARLQVSSKTGHRDGTVLLDLPKLQYLGRLLLLRERLCGQAGRVYATEADRLRHHFPQAAANAKVIGLQSTMYSLRHGGALHDRATDARDPLVIRGRIQWRAGSSLRKYKKCEQFSLELEKLAPAALHWQQILAEKGPTSFERRCERLLRSQGSA